MCRFAFSKCVTASLLELLPQGRWGSGRLWLRHTTACRCCNSASRVVPPQAEEHAMDDPQTTSTGAKDAPQVTPPVRQPQDGAGNQSLAALSNELVRIYKDQFGRGPTKVRSNYAGADTIVCLLENTFTPAEKSL